MIAAAIDLGGSGGEIENAVVGGEAVMRFRVNLRFE